MKRRKRRTPPRIKSGPHKGQFRKRSKSVRRRTRRVAAKRTATRRKNPVAKKRRTTRRRRRTYRRNPPILKQLTDGVQGAIAVVVGKAAARAVPTAAKMPTTGPMGIAAQIAVGLGVGMVANKFLGTAIGSKVLAGALAAPIESAIIKMNVPFLSSALGDYDDGDVYVDAYPDEEGDALIDAYPETEAVAAYPDNVAGVLAGLSVGEESSVYEGGMY